MLLYKRHRISKILKHNYRLYLKKGHRLPISVKEEIAASIDAVQQALMAGDISSAYAQAKKLDALGKRHFRRNVFDYTKDTVISLVFALLVAVVVRQSWFELYQIPTGSMRPTFKELDCLTVSKTQFSINIPLTLKHLFFDPALIKRSGIVIFTGQNMDIPDVDTYYFWLFPGKKQYVKRMIGKPGDTLYFYGGKIYGIDGGGNDISHELQLPRLQNIAHIPYITYEGKAITPMPPLKGIYSPVIIQQMHMPVAKLFITPLKSIQGEVLYNPLQNPTPPSWDYYDLWGYRNYGMCRLLKKKQVDGISSLARENLPNAPFYLEISHHPSFKTAKIGRDLYGRNRPMLGISKSYLPLSETHLKTLFSNLYTARFIVEKGYARRYGTKPVDNQTRTLYPYLPGVADGTYEFYYGKCYQVYPGGITRELSASHPLAKFNAERLYILYNIGIEFDNRFLAGHNQQLANPSRYAYFRNEDLYTMDGVLMKKDSPTLIRFLDREYEKQSSAAQRGNYVAFDDYGPPTNPDGSINANLISKYGIHVPEGQYLVLGDNYAMSGDSREFGFVPAENIRGVPDLIFWPPGNRLGHPNQPVYTIFTTPRIVVWIIALLIFAVWYHYHRKKYKLPLKL
ncbi:MAG: signal peptidase I [Simkaniaceae bacterium]|nr:signal peptidase I [Simkaniaceae bacterium]